MQDEDAEIDFTEPDGLEENTGLEYRRAGTLCGKILMWSVGIGCALYGAAGALQKAKPVFASRRGFGKHGGLLRLLSQHCLCVSGASKRKTGTEMSKRPTPWLRGCNVLTRAALWRDFSIRR
jgi:hypothetical protein